MGVETGVLSLSRIIVTRTPSRPGVHEFWLVPCPIPPPPPSIFGSPAARAGTDKEKSIARHSNAERIFFNLHLQKLRVQPIRLYPHKYFIHFYISPTGLPVPALGAVSVEFSPSYGTHPNPGTYTAPSERVSPPCGCSGSGWDVCSGWH